MKKKPEYDWTIGDEDLATLYELPVTEIIRRRELAKSGRRFMGQPSKKPAAIDWAKTNQTLMRELNVCYSTITRWRAQFRKESKVAVIRTEGECLVCLVQAKQVTFSQLLSAHRRAGEEAPAYVDEWTVLIGLSPATTILFRRSRKKGWTLADKITVTPD